ncbi:MAG: hypothetical protein II045_05970, partial [Oscillospiraceae bacterium]|nr:hypothetical protein [Oscillospiraceae bacterium]
GCLTFYKKDPVSILLTGSFFKLSKNSLTEFCASRRKRISIVFSDDMCVRKNTLRIANVRFARSQAVKSCAERSVILFKKAALPLF